VGVARIDLKNSKIITLEQSFLDTLNAMQFQFCFVFQLKLSVTYESWLDLSQRFEAAGVIFLLKLINCQMKLLRGTFFLFFSAKAKLPLQFLRTLMFRSELHELV